MKTSRTLNLEKDVYVSRQNTELLRNAKKIIRKYFMKVLQKPTKKANLSLPKKINIELKKIAKESNLDEKLNIMAKQICFVSIKDQKPDFRLNLKDRSPNPTKNELGKLNKHILQTININLRSKINVKQ